MSNNNNKNTTPKLLSIPSNPDLVSPLSTKSTLSEIDGDVNNKSNSSPDTSASSSPPMTLTTISPTKSKSNPWNVLQTPTKLTSAPFNHLEHKNDENVLLVPSINSSSTPSSSTSTSPSSSSCTTTNTPTKSFKDIMMEEEQLEKNNKMMISPHQQHDTNSEDHPYQLHPTPNITLTTYSSPSSYQGKKYNFMSKQMYNNRKNHQNVHYKQRKYHHNNHYSNNSNKNNHGYDQHSGSKLYSNTSSAYYYHRPSYSTTKKKKHYDDHYKSSPNYYRRNPSHNHNQYNNNNMRQHSKQQHYFDYDPFRSSHHSYDDDCDDSNYLMQSLTNMSLSTSSLSLSYNNNKNHEMNYTTMMSCEEYYAATCNTESYHNYQQPHNHYHHHKQKNNIPKSQRRSIIALDCEMVGVGESGERSALARVCIINFDYEVLLDTYVKVNEPVTDYRTFVSGIQPKDIQSDSSAMDFETCRNIVSRLMRNKILVGHGLENDLSALKIKHPRRQIRDTAMYPPYMTATLVNPMTVLVERRRRRSCSTTPSIVESDCSSITSTSSSFSLSSPCQGNNTSSNGNNGPLMQLKPRKLKEIAREWLGISIQKCGEEHSPLEDACAALSLYKIERVRWEVYMM